MSLADRIEAYLKECLQAEPKGCLEIQRRRLAGFFGCAPSQINYVLATRFTFEKGYRVESRRGGGGYLRIRCIRLVGDALGRIGTMGGEISRDTAERILTSLAGEGVLTRREAALVGAVMNSVPSSVAGGEARALILRAALQAILDDV